jgi:hypothetical protein
VNITALSSTILQPFGAAPATPIVPFVVFVDSRAAQLVAASSDADPFGVDPRAARFKGNT